ncbi:uncharacterized protein CLUP02_16666 [Colletotrichum lupini]|uniref:Uncharacterized protein n=1 Tax=Colletotrichum lupini TaxID=145971 RepID=A0A9Q8WQ73_9PEZI|nr:uncharacterized protein CLUP02_16666 [Colletotrichum lupini]UQC91132.1 hypothetical protein CLUP02_16666 [Colletotrichum lupini]
MPRPIARTCPTSPFKLAGQSGVSHRPSDGSIAREKNTSGKPTTPDHRKESKEPDGRVLVQASLLEENCIANLGSRHVAVPQGTTAQQTNGPPVIKVVNLEGRNKKISLGVCFAAW